MLQTSFVAAASNAADAASEPSGAAAAEAMAAAGLWGGSGMGRCGVGCVFVFWGPRLAPAYQRQPP